MGRKTHHELSHEDVLARLERVAKGGAVKALDAALVLRCSMRTIRRLIAQGILRVIRITQRTVYVDRTCLMGCIALPLPLDPVDASTLSRRLSR